MNKTILSAYYKHKQGGFTKRLYRAWKALDAAGYRVIYIAAEKLPVDGDNIQPVLVPMRSSPASVFYWPEFYWRAVHEARRLTKAEQARVHFMFSFFYASISILAGWGLKVDTLTFVRGNDVLDSNQKSFTGLRANVHRSLERFGVHFSRRIIVVSNALKSIIGQRSGGQEKISILPNDIGTQPAGISLPDIQTGVVKIVTVSVLTPHKNLKLVLEALKRLPLSNWEFLLVGGDDSGGSYLKELQGFAEQAGIAGQVKFLGWRDDVADILRTCHVFVFPTRNEGSPNALLEAMGYGMPCLASDIPEIREILPDSELLFSPDDPDELMVRLERLLSLPGYAGRIMEKTRQYSTRYQFDWDQRIVRLVTAATEETG